MSDIDVQLVRECFELNHFNVMTFWQHDRPAVSEPGLQLLAENTAPNEDGEAGFVLEFGGLAAIGRALIEVRAWHADRFYASVIESNPVLTHVADDDSIGRARDAFSGAEFVTVLVISELPPSEEPRQRAIDLLRSAGIGHVLEFPVLLHEIIERIGTHGAYAPSHSLQTLRLLKRYDFIRRQQLEFAFPTESPLPHSPVLVETAEIPEE